MVAASSAAIIAKSSANIKAAATNRTRWYGRRRSVSAAIGDGSAEGDAGASISTSKLFTRLKVALDDSPFSKPVFSLTRSAGMSADIFCGRRWAGVSAEGLVSDRGE
jgi:hypothetical protein